MLINPDICLTCRFYFDQGEAGYCRRLPPVPLVTRFPRTLNGVAEIGSYFPTMSPAGWCGEFQRREVPANG